MDPLSPIAIAHVGLTVSDLAAALRFWEPFLGRRAHARPRLDRAYTQRLVGIDGVVIEAAFIRIGAAGTLELLQYLGSAPSPAGPDHNRPGHAHVCLAVGDVAATAAAAVALGATIVGQGPVSIDAGPNAGLDAVYLRVPPDDHTVELFGSSDPNRV